MHSLLSAGSNAQGQLSNGTADDSHSFRHCLLPEALGNQSRILSLACGANHTLALSQGEDNIVELWGCGDESHGQLGSSHAHSETFLRSFTKIDLISTSPRLQGYTYRLICASWQTSYVLLSSPEKTDILLSLGADNFGDLGIGRVGEPRIASFPNIVTFSHISINGVLIGDTPIKVKAMSAGQHHIIVIMALAGLTESIPVGWGVSRHGQLGQFLAGGKPIPFLSLPQILPLDPTERYTNVALGSQHSVLLTESRHAVGLGSNRKGQIQCLDTISQIQSVKSTWNGTYIVHEDTEGRISLVAIGSHSKGQLGRSEIPAEIPPPGPVYFPFDSSTHELQDVTCGSEHVLALFSVQSMNSNSETNTEVWGWGWNEHGNLGTGETIDVPLPMRIWPPCSPSESCLEAVEDPGQAYAIWAGPGTSWIATR